LAYPNRSFYNGVKLRAVANSTDALAIHIDCLHFLLIFQSIFNSSILGGFTKNASVSSTNFVLIRNPATSISKSHFSFGDALYFTFKFRRNYHFRLLPTQKNLRFDVSFKFFVGNEVVIFPFTSSLEVREVAEIVLNSNLLCQVNV
jgi:hypothetical protein